MNTGPSTVNLSQRKVISRPKISAHCQNHGTDVFQMAKSRYFGRSLSDLARVSFASVQSMGVGVVLMMKAKNDVL